MKKVAVGLMMFLAGVVTVPGVYGDEFSVIPSVSVRGEYNDNIFYTVEDEEDDFITTTAAMLELSERTERLNLNLKGRVAPFWYANNSDLDDVDQDYRSRINYLLTPQSSARADGFFIVDHRRDRDIVSTGVVQNSQQRKRYHFGAGVNHMFSELFAADLSYDFNKDDWNDSSDNEDYRGNIVNLGLTYDLGRWWEPTTATMNFGYANYDYDTSETDSYFGSIGALHWFSETFNVRVNAGARYIDADFDVPQLVPVPPAGFRVVTKKENNTGWGATGSAVVEYRGERTRSNILLSRDISPSGTNRGPTVLTRAVFNVNYLLLEKLRIGLSGGYYRNRADSGDFSTEDIDEDTYRIWPSIRWEFYNNFTLEGAYYFTYLDDNEDNTTTTRNQAYLEVAYGLPLSDILDFTASEARQIIEGAVPLPESR